MQCFIIDMSVLSAHFYESYFQLHLSNVFTLTPNFKYPHFFNTLPQSFYITPYLNVNNPHQLK